MDLVYSLNHTIGILTGNSLLLLWCIRASGSHRFPVLPMLLFLRQLPRALSYTRSRNKGMAIAACTVGDSVKNSLSSYCFSSMPIELEELLCVLVRG